MYESPKRDGGYDVSDYRSVRSEYGTLEHLRELLDEAHAQGIRVVVDLPISHTSCDHPWFQEARSPESPKRDWYVWSETDDRYLSAKVLFDQTEPSNWTWDHAAGAYFWHRLYSHEPDLNYDNPEVEEAMLDVLRFWLDFGFDGVRLLGVPYMYERDDTSCENLNETHEFLKRMRAEVREHYPDRVLVMEPNQQAHEAAAYFGEGDECHMVNHFPLIPRMFMALWRENATPLYEILDSTPQLPDGCSWALLMRMNDELTLEMVTDEEHDYMYAEYAKDPRMRATLGVRRRVAPLIDNSRDELELLHAALFSLPGSPVLYYGDEIGMGDNIHLGLRDGVRTPMHWTGDRNAGFSRADWRSSTSSRRRIRFYGFQAVNVEAQLRTPNSLLSWLPGSLRSASSIRCSASAASSVCTPTTRASSPTCGATRTRS